LIQENNETYGLEDSLIIPVAAKSILSIEKYVGTVTERSNNGHWLYLDFAPLSMDRSMPVWQKPRSELFDSKRQCWVHIDYSGYRKCYQRCFPELDLDQLVVDHIRNRRFAKQLGFEYVRLLHVARGVNSSSGRGEEYNVINYQNPDGLSKFKHSDHEINYADPADLLKMLNIKVGAFPLNNLRDHMHLFYG